MTYLFPDSIVILTKCNKKSVSVNIKPKRHIPSTLLSFDIEFCMIEHEYIFNFFFLSHNFRNELSHNHNKSFPLYIFSSCFFSYLHCIFSMTYFPHLKDFRNCDITHFPRRFEAIKMCEKVTKTSKEKSEKKRCDRISSFIFLCWKASCWTRPYQVTCFYQMQKYVKKKMKKNQVEEKRKWKSCDQSPFFYTISVFSHFRIQLFTLNKCITSSFKKSHNNKKKCFTSKMIDNLHFSLVSVTWYYTYLSISFPIKIEPKWLWEWVLIFFLPFLQSFSFQLFYTIPFPVYVVILNICVSCHFKGKKYSDWKKITINPHITHPFLCVWLHHSYRCGFQRILFNFVELLFYVL